MCFVSWATHRLRHNHFLKAVQTLFNMRAKYLWSKPMIDKFFNDLYLVRTNFLPHVEEEITRMQSIIKKVVQQKKQATTLDILEPANPVVDGRTNAVDFQSSAGVWSNQQTNLIDR